MINVLSPGSSRSAKTICLQQRKQSGRDALASILILTVAIASSSCVQPTYKCQDITTETPTQLVFVKPTPIQPIVRQESAIRSTNEVDYLRIEVKKFEADCVDVDHLPIESASGRRPGFRDHSLFVTTTLEIMVRPPPPPRSETPDLHEAADEWLFLRQIGLSGLKLTFQARSARGVSIKTSEVRVPFSSTHNGIVVKEINYSMSNISSAELSKIHTLSMRIDDASE